MLWIRDDWGFAVQLVGNYYTGDKGRTRVISTPYGAARFAAVEDLLVKRLASAKHWQAREDLAHATLLWAAQKGDIDWAYVDHVAKEYRVTDLLAEFKHRIREGPA